MPTWLTPTRILIAVVSLGLLLLILGLAGSYHSGKLSDLKLENQRISDSYNQQIGIAKANELAAREEVLKAQALVAAVEQGNRNVAALDKKIEAAGKDYEAAKNDLGECPDVNDCIRRLCYELRANGFRVTCPD